MRTFAVISQKGGAGKSTLACNFATIAGEREPSFLLDRDPQATASKWWHRRHEEEGAAEAPDLIALDGETLTSAVAGLKGQAGNLFVDTRPAVQEPEAEAVRCADLVIVPVRPTVNDVEAVLATLAMIKSVGRPAAIIVNSARNERRAKDAFASLAQHGIPVCPIYIGDRTVYHDAALNGRAVTEMKGAAADAAGAELRKAWNWIEGIGR